MSGSNWNEAALPHANLLDVPRPAGYLRPTTNIAAYPSEAAMLPNGDYPFIDRAYPLSELAFIEAPQELENLLRDQAAANGINIVRDALVELRCRYSGYPDATFLVFWPTGNERLNILAPKGLAPVRQA